MITSTLGTHQLVVFTLDAQAYGLPLTCVERAARMVQITPLPKAPNIIAGIIDVHGRLVPVFDLRRRFNLTDRAVDAGDQLLVARSTRRAVALIADSVLGVVEYSDAQIVNTADIRSHIDHVQGIVKLADGMVLIHDLDAFLSLDEETALDRAMEMA